MIRLVFKSLIAAATLYGACASAQAEVRVALVIGNGAYQNVPRLVNPANDATDVAAALKRDGFDTIFATDLNKDQMDEATIKFAKAARTADVAMFYYSGHALQFAGANYLAPVDARLTDEADLRRFVRVDEIVSDLQQAKNLRILVLDACRNNPLADALRRSIGATRAIPLQRGLAKIDTPQGMIVSYSTQAGTEAEDGNGRNSPYTTAFLKEIEKQDEIGTVFRRISTDVYEATNHAQFPELSLSLIGEFYLRGKLDVAVAPSAPQPQDTTNSDFAAAERVDTIGGWDAFLARHPDGYFSQLARERRTKLLPKVTTDKPPPSNLDGDRQPATANVAPAANSKKPRQEVAALPTPQPQPSQGPVDLSAQRALLPQVVARYRSLNSGNLSEFAGVYDGEKRCETVLPQADDPLFQNIRFNLLLIKQVIWFEGDEMISVRFSHPETQFRARLTFLRDFSLAQGGAIKLYTASYPNGNSEEIGFYQDRFVIDPKIDGNSITYKYATRCKQETQMVEYAQKLYDAQLANKRN